MRTPEHNEEGYRQSAVHNMTALNATRRFLVMHGSGDDNVHFQNTLSLIDNLDLSGVDKYDMMVYPDSHHSIAFHSANKMVYKRLSSWLIDKFGTRRGNRWEDDADRFVNFGG